MNAIAKTSYLLVLLTLALGGLRCVGEDAMDGMELNCSNGEDDDGDGTVDCADPDCTAAPICTSSCNFNYVCESGENNNNCPTDCQTAICGNAACEAGETLATCPVDCGGGSPVCGNGACEAGETPQSCPADCGISPVCGNGVCELGESYMNCPDDCTINTCGNAVCDWTFGESSTTCPADCAVGNITGVVYHSYTSAPLEGYTFQLVSGTDVLDVTVSDVNGVFTFTDVPVGNYNVHANVTADQNCYDDPVDKGVVVTLGGNTQLSFGFVHTPC